MKKSVSIFFTILFLVLSIKSESQDAKKIYTQGEIDYNNGRFTEAIGNYTLVISLDSTFINAWLHRGFCKGMIKDFKGAIEDYTKVISMDSKLRFAYLSRGSAKNKLEEFQSAMDDFNIVLELDPFDQEAYNNRGFSWKGLGEKEKACDDWIKSKQMGNEEAKIILKNNRCREK